MQAETKQQVLKNHSSHTLTEKLKILILLFKEFKVQEIIHSVIETIHPQMVK